MTKRESDNRRRLRESWTTNASLWTQAVRDGAIESRRLVTDQAIFDAIAARKPRRVLDLGCGEGWLVRALIKRGLQAVGVDGSAALIAQAEGAGEGTYVCATYDALAATPTHAGAGFDLIAANFALLDDQAGPLLRALRGIMRADGALIIQTLHPLSAGPPYEDGWRTETFEAFTDASWQAMPWYFRTLGSWVSLLHDSGFTLSRLSEPGHPGGDAPLSLLLEAALPDPT